MSSAFPRVGANAPRRGAARRHAGGLVAARVAARRRAMSRRRGTLVRRGHSGVRGVVRRSLTAARSGLRGEAAAVQAAGPTAAAALDAWFQAAAAVVRGAAAAAGRCPRGPPPDTKRSPSRQPECWTRGPTRVPTVGSRSRNGSFGRMSLNGRNNPNGPETRARSHSAVVERRSKLPSPRSGRSWTLAALRRPAPRPVLRSRRSITSAPSHATRTPR